MGEGKSGLQFFGTDVCVCFVFLENSVVKLLTTHIRLRLHTQTHFWSGEKYTNP